LFADNDINLHLTDQICSYCMCNMISDKQILLFSYDARNFNFIVKSCDENESSFDNILRQTWRQAEKAKAFRYTLNIESSKTLRGKYRFLTQVLINKSRIVPIILIILSVYNTVNNFAVESRQSSI